MQKIAVIGKTGQLAQALSTIGDGENWVFFGRDKVDLSNSSEFTTFLQGQSFDILINTAAYTAVDQAETEKEQANQINGEAVGDLAKICLEKSATLIHISTDYVFDGNSNRPLTEDERTEPINHYGRSKWLGEKLIREHLDRHIIIRTSWLYGDQGHNFPKTMLKLASKRSELKVVFDQVGNPTYALDLAKAIVHICALKEITTRLFGTYHYSNEGVCSWFDFALATVEEKYPQTKVSPVTSEQFPKPAKRPNYSVLDKKKFRDTFGLEIRHWRKALDEFLQKTHL